MEKQIHCLRKGKNVLIPNWDDSDDSIKMEIALLVAIGWQQDILNESEVEAIRLNL